MKKWENEKMKKWEAKNEEGRQKMKNERAKKWRGGKWKERREKWKSEKTTARAKGSEFPNSEHRPKTSAVFLLTPPAGFLWQFLDTSRTVSNMNHGAPAAPSRSPPLPPPPAPTNGKRGRASASTQAGAGVKSRRVSPGVLGPLTVSGSSPPPPPSVVDLVAVVDPPAAVDSVAAPLPPVVAPAASASSSARAPSPAVDPQKAKACARCGLFGFKKYDARENTKTGALVAGNCSKCKNARRDQAAAGLEVEPVRIGRPPGERHKQTAARREKKAGQMRDQQEQRAKLRGQLEAAAFSRFCAYLIKSNRDGRERSAGWQVAPRNMQQEEGRAERAARCWLQKDSAKIAAAITSAAVEEFAADFRALRRGGEDPQHGRREDCRRGVCRPARRRRMKRPAD